MKQSHFRRIYCASAGFTLIETMVALLIISIGVLGIAKMQALALASTGTARMRSIASIEAASMASMMRANHAYWSSITKDLTITVKASDGSFTTTDSAVAAPGAGCTVSAPCTGAQLAGYDVSTWGTALKQSLPPNGTATITCPAGSATKPVSCTVQLNWTENLVELNTGMSSTDTAANNNTALQNTAATHFVLYVEP